MILFLLKIIYWKLNIKLLDSVCLLMTTWIVISVVDVSEWIEKTIKNKR